MDMNSYLREIEYAATSVIKLVWDEHAQMNDLDARIQLATKEVEEGYRLVQFLQDNPELDDDHLSTAVHWDTYFGPDKERHYAFKDRERLEELISTRAFSRAAQSASLLQYGKQGISLVYGKPSNCSDGRMLGAQALREVIWQGRNHALHWEEGKPKAAVEECFQKLAADFGPRFADYGTRNLAFEVVEVLGWTSFDAFKADMLTL